MKTSRKNKKVIPVIEEQIDIDKEIVETGKVVISKKITEHEKNYRRAAFARKSFCRASPDQ